MSNHIAKTAPAPLTLISHVLCPYVQRVSILLAEKGASFERVNIDLNNKPKWFLDISPLGKTPVLQVGEHSLFESAVICEYLDETILPALHPSDPLQRAQHRAWMEFGSTVLNGIAGLYTAPTEFAMRSKALELRQRFEQLELQLTSSGHRGHYFSGADFSLVDAVFGPVFRYFDVLDEVIDLDLFTDLPKVKAWRAALSKRPSVRDAVSSDYADRLRDFLAGKQSAMSGYFHQTSR